MGIPPTRNNDWSFEQWSKHAHYADRVGLSPHQPHFYFQAGVDKSERFEDPDDWTFISKDLPSFSSTEGNFFEFSPEEQKGIQCRFGERGVTAATHYDSGRNMVAMITGAKRYILSPPRECSKLGIVNNEGNAIFRHSMLNFGHLNHMYRDDMPAAERQWLERASEAQAISTVLKAGEVLYIPSHWFHYITSLQKSAQCNVRSGVDHEGDKVFGGIEDVTFKCNAPTSEM
jgi:Cupin-like domain